MKAERQTADPRAQHLRQSRTPVRKQAHEFLLWYWAFSFPRHSRLLRVIYIQPLVGVLLIPIGLLIGLLGHVPLPVGLILSLSGVALIGLTYPISNVYHTEYPGRFDPRLEEYVARRVSRLAKDHFIPQFHVHGYSHTSEIRNLRGRLRQALRIELRRLELSDATAPAPVCGVLVLGPKHSNKTGALWDAMAQELKGWTFVAWPHHMDHPANLAGSVGHRVVLWVDDLRDYAHPAEAAALAQFVQQVRAQGRCLMLLTSCREGQNLQEAERYFRPLMQQLRVVSAENTLPLVPKLQELEQAYQHGLSASQKSILDAMSWLKSLGVLTFPEDVLRVLSTFFLREAAHPNGESQWEDWGDMVRALSQQSARFVRVDQRADAQMRLAEQSYSFAGWLRYNWLNRRIRRTRRDTVFVPINIHYLDLERSRSDRARTITALEQKPDVVIRALAAHAVAAETLILLGDAYLDRLGENLVNANELAIKCYEAAFDALKLFPSATPASHFPGAGTAALVGKANAELRDGREQEAENDFRQVTQQPFAMPSASLAPTIPAGLLARAWHGRGDAKHALAADARGNTAMQLLREAAEYYDRAAQALTAADPTSDPSNDPLRAETQLDYANVLYELAEFAAKQSETRPAGATPQLATDTAHQPSGDTALPPDDLAAAQDAYEEALRAYSRAAAPAVWAEIECRRGNLCLMSAQRLLHANSIVSHPAAGGVDVSQGIPLTDNGEAIDLARKARNHFVAAKEVYTPSFLPVSWSSAQLGLANALLILARSAAKDAREEARERAWDSYALCLESTKAASHVSTVMEAPLDWVDLQLLSAEAEIGRAPLDDGGAAPHYGAAKMILDKTDQVLAVLQQFKGAPPDADRMKDQEAKVKALRQELERLARDA